MAERTVKVRLEAATASYLAAMRQASAVTSQFGRDIAGVGDISDRNLQRVSRGALLMSGGIAVGLGLAGKAAVDWESAWAGVTKTVDGSEAQLAGLEEGLRGLARELPATHGEIAGVAEAAGQLGIKVGDVEDFTRVMVDLGETTNMTAEEAATSLARISNIMGTSSRDIDRMGSTIVELGNNSATTEGEIVEMSTRLAAAGKIAGLSEADVFAFASTLTSVGVEAEAGGTALSKVFTKVRDAVLDGGDALDTFAEVSGVSTEQFAAAFEEDAAGAVAMFIEGLGEMNATGQSTTQVFDDLELADQRLMRALLSTASAGDLLTEQLDMAGRAWEENTALQTEAEKRYETTAAQLEILRNKASDLGITAGSVLLPALNGVVDGLGGVMDGVSALPDPVQHATTMLAGLSGVGLGLVGAIGTIAPKARAAKDALSTMGSTGQFVGRNLGRISGALAGVGAAVAVGTYLYGEATKASREYADTVADLAGDLGAVAEGQATVNDVIGDFLSEKISDPSDLEVLRAFEVTFEDMKLAIESGADVLDPFRQKVRDLGVDLEGIDLGKLDDTAMADPVNRLADALGVGKNQLQDFIDAIEDYDDAAQDAAQTQLEAIASTDDLNAARVRAVEVIARLLGKGDNYAWQLAQLESGNDEAAAAAGGLTGEMDAQEVAAEALEDALDDLKEAYDALIGVNLSAEQANLKLEESFATLPGLLGENGASLDALTEAGRENRSAISDVVGGIMDHVQALDEQGASTDEVNFYLQAQRERLREVMRQAGFTEDQIATYIDTLGLTPENIDTLVELHGTAEAEARLESLTRNRQIVVDVYSRISGWFGPETQNNATGGLIHHLTGGGEVSYLAMGGSPFQPRGSDTVPAMLTPGEYVVRKQAVDRLGVGFLDELNTFGEFRSPAPTGGGMQMDYARLAQAVAKVAGPTFHMENTNIVPDAQAAGDEVAAAFRTIELANS